MIMKGTYRSPEETKDLLRMAISHLNTIAFGCNGLLKWLEPFRYDDITGYIYICIFFNHTTNTCIYASNCIVFYVCKYRL